VSRRRPGARLSLRTRATVLGTVAIAVLLTAGSVLLVTTLEDRLVAASDQLSRSRVDDLRQLAREGDLPRSLPDVGDDGVAQVVGTGGQVLAASPNVEGRPPIAGLGGGPEPRVRTLRAPDDAESETYRVWYAGGEGPTGSVTVYVGSSLEAVSEASATLRRALWLGVPVTVAVLCLVIWLLLGRVLARLDRIRAEVDRISDDNLGTRVAGDGVEDEVGRLAATMNAMLARLGDSARRQRDLVADVSHDLQSPLAVQRVALELALARPDGIDAERLRSEVLGATDDMERLVRDLLVLASVDAGPAPSPRLLDLDELVLEEVARARASAGVHIDTSGVSAAPAYANADDVRRIVRNLLDNAVTHADRRVELAVGVDGGRARLDVVDDGPGIPGDQAERVFDRFHRLEPARSRAGGSGLGLAIARSLADRAGGSLELVARSSGGAHLRLLLPAGAVSGG
jgi:signal transduction histidine kinase